MRTDGWTDMTKRLVDFRNFANAPKNEWCCTPIPPNAFLACWGTTLLFNCFLVRPKITGECGLF